MKVYIDPVMCDVICRNALENYAIRKGLDTTKNYMVKNLNWHLNHKRPGVTFSGKEKK